MNRYKPTQLEQWVNNFFSMNGIVSINQLNIDELASKFNVWVYFLEQGSQTIENDGMYSICIDRRLSESQQWEDFLHELCHVLRHAGNQIQMPVSFLELQETEAQSFQLYAAIPYSMLPRELPQNTWETLNYFVDHFGVTYELAGRRLEQIQRRILQYQIDQSINAMDIIKPSIKEQTPETRRILAQLHYQIARRRGKQHG
jgi:Zn-dependent peptidase ImmA (M78 family)